MLTRYIKFIRRKWANLSFSKKMDIKLPKPVVSFTFDDAPVSAFVNGGGILAKFGFGGTFYISLSLMNGPDPETRFTIEHLKTAIAQHSELGCHTYSHMDLSKTSAAKGIADIEQNQQQLDNLLPGETFKNFSYPFGSETLPLKKYASKRFRSARGIEEGINLEGTDLCNLKTVKLYEGKYPLEYLFEKLSEAEKNNGWLIFYTHDVDENYTDWGCSPTYFEAVVHECAKRGITVATINQALNLIENKTHES
ncbi:MAG: oligosaccharide deacetylase HfsH [Saprospiraceae bacterium]